MANSENTTLSMFIKMRKNDKRMILFRNLRCVAINDFRRTEITDILAYISTN